MQILVTGASGQLGQALKKTQPTGAQVIYASRQELDLDYSSDIANFIAKNSVRCIINCAAYTKVDLAEKEPEKAFAGNRDAIDTLAQLARIHDIYLIHISTDFLFHGAHNTPIDESVQMDPRGVYAKSKAAGELAVFESGARATILRTSWLYSEFGSNFMKTIIRLAKEKPELSIIADQHGSPTYAVDLARAVWRLVERKHSQIAPKEIFHFANFGVTTWYDFAVSIVELAGMATPVKPILTHEYPLPTPRPAYSALWPRKFSETFQFPIRNWRNALKDAIAAGEKV